jgi:hypothetical protein
MLWLAMSLGMVFLLAEFILKFTDVRTPPFLILAVSVSQWL